MKKFFLNQPHLKNSLLAISCCVLAVFLSSCAPLATEPEIIVSPFPEPEHQGIYHKVAKGETIWRVAKAYHVSISDIIQANNIPNAAQIEVNQLLFIPGAYDIKSISQDLDQAPNEFIWPVNGKVIGFFHQNSNGKYNQGIDIKADYGSKVVASRAGTVVFADYLPGYGQTVMLDHEDGFYSVYSHNYDVFVKLGDAVLKRTEIARVGTENKLSYLHFQIRRNALEQNPLHYLP